MYSEEDLSSAVKAGVLSDETATAFRDHVARLKSETAVDAEHFRLVAGFNDIFVVIACSLLLLSMTLMGVAVVPWLGSLLAAVSAWLLAEFFTRKRRMALPSILLVLTFVGGVFATGVAVLSVTQAFHHSYLAAAVAAVAAWLYWLRFRVPITVAAGLAAVVGGVFAFVRGALPDAAGWPVWILFVAGLLVFALAMRWDATDRQRQTLRSDVAFWLHLLAAPLIVHPVFTSLGVFGGQATSGQAVAVVALYVVIAMVSLCIDRRALMVSALIYVLYMLTALLKQSGVVSLSFAITALVIGSALLLLSAFWHASRARALGLLPSALRSRLA